MVARVGFAAVALAIGLAVYPEHRVVTWFEFLTDGFAPDSMASAAQEVLSNIWADAFTKNTVDASGQVEAKLLELMTNASVWSIVEIAAGAGGAAAAWNSRLRAGGAPSATVLLTDLQPNVQAWRALREEHGDAIKFVEASVDATTLATTIGPRPMPRMIHLALHHFPPGTVRAVFADVLRSGASIIVADLAPNAGGLHSVA